MIPAKRLPRVVIDGRMVGESLNGIGRYTVLIAKGLAEQPKLEYEPVFLCRPGMSERFSAFETIEVKTPYLDLKEAISIPGVVLRSRAKLFHMPAPSHVIAVPSPYVITIHDLVNQEFGNPYEKIYDQTILRTLADRAKKVLTVSEFSRREILKWHSKCDAVVVPNALDPVFLKEDHLDDEGLLARHGLTRGRYFLCLSNAKAHKNVGQVVRAFLLARERLGLAKDWKLVLSLKNYAEEPGVLALGGLADTEVLPLLRGARALTFPSHYEGFGLPVLEAGVMGVPLLVSDIPAHREALADVPPREVQWIDSHSVELWARALVRASQGDVRPLSQDSRAKLIARHHVSRFGARLDQVYRDVLLKKPEKTL